MQKASAAMYSPAQDIRYDEAYTSFERTAFSLRAVQLRSTLNVDGCLLTTAEAIKYWTLTRVIVFDG